MKNTNILICNSQLTDNDTNQQLYTKSEETKDCHAQVFASNDSNDKDDIIDGQCIKVQNQILIFWSNTLTSFQLLLNSIICYWSNFSQENRQILFERNKKSSSRFKNTEKLKQKVLVDEKVYKDRMLPKISVTEIFDDRLLETRNDDKKENVN